MDLFDVAWTHGAQHMRDRHGLDPAFANEATTDPAVVVISPDYNSRSGRSVRVIGYSHSRDAILTVIVLVHDGTTYGVNGWHSNSRDRRIYRRGTFDG